MSATPLGVVAVALASITAAAVLFGNKTSQLTKSIQKNNETLKDYKNTMADVEKQKNQSLSKSMNEISYYQSLYNELKGITDENGYYSFKGLTTGITVTAEKENYMFVEKTKTFFTQTESANFAALPYYNEQDL